MKVVWFHEADGNSDEKRREEGDQVAGKHWKVLTSGGDVDDAVQSFKRVTWGEWEGGGRRSG